LSSHRKEIKHIKSSPGHFVMKLELGPIVILLVTVGSSDFALFSLGHKGHATGILNFHDKRIQ
jgi:hypothetical protein